MSHVGSKELREFNHTAHLDHSSVATLRAVTDATQSAISNGPTTWHDVEMLLHKFGRVDIVTREAFPDSRVVSDIADSVTKELNDRGFTAENTLFSASVCPDEINHAHNNLSQMFTRKWGECFQMGGLAGIPFSGQTGFGAFSAHVPHNGNLFILFAPHIGISPAGEFGLYAREGQGQKCGTACGAAIAAHKHIVAGGAVPDFTHLGQYPFDYQQQWIISKLAEKMEVINSADNKMVELSKQMYYIIEDFIHNIISSEGISGSTALLGGIHINTPSPMEDFFWPICFEIYRKGGKPIDLIKKIRRDLNNNDVDSTVVTSGDVVVTKMLVRTLSTMNVDEAAEISLKKSHSETFASSPRNMIVEEGYTDDPFAEEEK